MNRKEQLFKKKELHKSALESLYKQTTGQTISGEQLWKKLRLIENKARKETLSICNGEFEVSYEYSHSQINIYERKVSELFCNKLSFFVNDDARGHVFKIENPPSGMYRDFAGYGLLGVTL